MKKTLIALAVTASAAVSCSAMAWTTNGAGGSVELSGTLTPVTKATPWSVYTGSAVTDLSAQLSKGQSEVDFMVKKTIPILGIRTTDARMFAGGPGITPQIDYRGSIDINKFKVGTVPLHLELKNATDDSVIGTLEGRLTAAALLGYSNTGDTNINNATGTRGVYATTAGRAFFGGLTNDRQQMVAGQEVWNLLNKINPEFVVNFPKAAPSEYTSESFDKPGYAFYAAYGSGIEAGTSLKIKLNQPAGNDAINWKASLPVTVYYQ
ncbi:TPA: hypothetical protein O3H02_004287 [Salmonella enterica subsp. enterica serovar Saintpaul str. CFSAN004144]|nr:hypothetical protein [Salmonella enterica subsp. enterica serovar Saintpaul str. CFSAN004144]